MRPKTWLNQLKNGPSGPFDSFVGFRSSAQSAGESVSALKAEISTEIAIVIANCCSAGPGCRP